MPQGHGSEAPRSLGRYEFVVEVAKGQLGPLWLAHVGAMLFAVRRVPIGPPLERTDVDRLSEAAWWSLDVRHDNVASVLDVVMTENELGVVSRYVPGEPLRSLLRLSSFKRKPVAVPTAMRIALDILGGLSAAHEQAQPASGAALGSGGVNPDTVLIGAADGRALLLDVGIAAVAASISSLADHPELGAYSAPEQLDRPDAAEPRSDVFSLGVLMWEMISSRRLFAGASQAAIREKLEACAIPRLDTNQLVGGEPVPAAVADLVARALARDPGDRFDSAAAMSDAIRELGADMIANHASVAAMVEELAGQAIATRSKALKRATMPQKAQVGPRPQLPTLVGIAPDPPPAPPPPQVPVASAAPEPEPRALVSAPEPEPRALVPAPEPSARAITEPEPSPPIFPPAAPRAFTRASQPDAPPPVPPAIDVAPAPEPPAPVHPPVELPPPEPPVTSALEPVTAVAPREPELLATPTPEPVTAVSAASAAPEDEVPVSIAYDAPISEPEPTTVRRASAPEDVLERPRPEPSPISERELVEALTRESNPGPPPLESIDFTAQSSEPRIAAAPGAPVAPELAAVEQRPAAPAQAAASATAAQAAPIALPRLTATAQTKPAVSTDAAKPAGVASPKAAAGAAAVSELVSPPAPARAPMISDSLFDAPPSQEQIQRTQKARKMVAGVVAGLSLLLVIGLIVSAAESDDDTATPEVTEQSKPTATALETPHPPVGQAALPREEPPLPASDRAPEPEEKTTAEKPEPEPEAEAPAKSEAQPAPRRVSTRDKSSEQKSRPPVRSASKPGARSTTSRPATKPKAKKPKYVPPGI